MAKMMAIALPVVALGAAAFTGGTSLGLFGADAAATAGTAAAADAGDAAFLGSAAAAASAPINAADAALTGATIGSALPAATGGLASTIGAVSPWLKGAALASQIGGTLIQARGNQQAGENAQEMANLESAQLKINANNELGAASEQVQQQDRETQYALSNAAAATAAGGGAVTDPSTQNVMRTIAGQGKLRALTDMYNGQSAAQATNAQAAMTQYGGQLQNQAYQDKMWSGLLAGGSAVFDKYADLD